MFLEYASPFIKPQLNPIYSDVHLHVYPRILLSCVQFPPFLQRSELFEHGLPVEICHYLIADHILRQLYISKGKSQIIKLSSYNDLYFWFKHGVRKAICNVIYDFFEKEPYR